MTAAQRRRLEALGYDVETAIEGDGWTALSITGEGVAVVVRDDDDEHVQTIIDAHEHREEADAHVQALLERRGE